MRRAGLDMDGVLYDWNGTATYLLNTRFGYQLQKDWPHWSHRDNGIADEHWEWLWSEGIKLGLFRHGNCYKGAFDAVQQLQHRGWRIVIITSRPESARQDTLDWLSFHGIPTDEVHVLGNNRLKSDVKHCNLYVDDRVENVDELARATTGRVLLMDRPWNRKAISLHEDGRAWQRIHSWREVAEYA